MKEKLKRLRKLAGVSQSVVANAIGVTLSAYSNYEQGIREPSLAIFKNICLYYGVSANYLLDIDEQDIR